MKIDSKNKIKLTDIVKRFVTDTIFKEFNIGNFQTTNVLTVNPYYNSYDSKYNMIIYKPCMIIRWNQTSVDNGFQLHSYTLS